jgi:hypothetical protein
MDEANETAGVQVTDRTWTFKAWTGPTIVESVRKTLEKTAGDDQRIVKVWEGTENVWIEVTAETEADAKRSPKN